MSDNLTHFAFTCTILPDGMFQVLTYKEDPNGALEKRRGTSNCYGYAAAKLAKVGLNGPRPGASAFVELWNELNMSSETYFGFSFTNEILQHSPCRRCQKLRDEAIRREQAAGSSKWKAQEIVKLNLRLNFFLKQKSFAKICRAIFQTEELIESQWALFEDYFFNGFEMHDELWTEKTFKELLKIDHVVEVYPQKDPNLLINPDLFVDQQEAPKLRATLMACFLKVSPGADFHFLRLVKSFEWVQWLGGAVSKVSVEKPYSFLPLKVETLFDMDNSGYKFLGYFLAPENTLLFDREGHTFFSPEKLI